MGHAAGCDDGVSCMIGNQLVQMVKCLLNCHCTRGPLPSTTSHSILNSYAA